MKSFLVIALCLCLHQAVAYHAELKNSVEYGDKLQGKILELIELVDANITKSAKQQQSSYHNEMDTATVLLEGRRCLLSTPLYTS